MTKKLTQYPRAGGTDLNREAVFPTRPAHALTCPFCWTEQRAERDRCYHCGARFIFHAQPERKRA